MFEPNGEPVYDEEDNDEFYVIGKPFCDNGVWTCNVARKYD